MRRCWMVARPSITMVYIHIPGDPEYLDLARRFVFSYLKNPPGEEHDTVICCNARPPSLETEALFKPLPNVRYIHRDDTGWDVGGFIYCANRINTEITLCFGGPGYVQRPGWMTRMLDAWEKYGPGMYGSLATYEVSPHINTTGFWCPTKTLAEYPITVRSRQERYDFEHGRNALWRMFFVNGFPVMLVTWDGEYEWREWRKPPNVYRRGDQSNCLTYFRHTDNFAAADPVTKIYMADLCDTLKDHSTMVSLERMRLGIPPPPPVLGGGNSLVKQLVQV